MDKYYGNVCELDIIFSFTKAYYILDEILLAGELQESSKKNVLRCIGQQDSLEDMEVSSFPVFSSFFFSSQGWVLVVYSLRVFGKVSVPLTRIFLWLGRGWSHTDHVTIPMYLLSSERIWGLIDWLIDCMAYRKMGRYQVFSFASILTLAIHRMWKKSRRILETLVFFDHSSRESEYQSRLPTTHRLFFRTKRNEYRNQTKPTNRTTDLFGTKLMDTSYPKQGNFLWRCMHFGRAFIRRMNEYGRLLTIATVAKSKKQLHDIRDMHDITEKWRIREAEETTMI